MGEENEDREILRRRPDRDPKIPVWKIDRTPPKGAYTATCISHDLLGAELHWWSRRKTPCWLTEDCPMCLAGSPREWYSYVAFVDGTRAERGLWEFPFGTLWAWDEAFCRYRTLRGLRFKCWRSPERSTGSVQTAFGKKLLDPKELAKAPDVERMLQQVYDVPFLFERNLSIIRSPMERVQPKEKLG